MDIYVANPFNLLWLLILPIVTILLVKYMRWKISKRKLFANKKFEETIFGRKERTPWLNPILYLLATLFLVLAVVDFVGGSKEVETKQKYSHVMFLLDISNSMNAEDVEPSRLATAKRLMQETMAKMTNDKVGIVIFAGDAISIMPLTSDYSSIETYISGLETSSMKVQGTDFLKGMKTVAKKMLNVNTSTKKVVILSDGEDNEGNESDAISIAKKNDLVVTTVGIGSDEGAPIPEYLFGQLMGYKMDYDGNTVISKRQTQALRALASKTGGSYIDGNSSDASQQIIDSLKRTSSTTLTKVNSQNAIRYYKYFLAISFTLFMIVLLVNPKKDFNF